MPSEVDSVVDDTMGRIPIGARLCRATFANALREALIARERYRLGLASASRYEALGRRRWAEIEREG